MGLIQRDHYVDDPLDRIRDLENRVAALERRVATLLRVVNSGTAGATEQGWYQVTDPDGNAGYVRIYASK